MSAFTFVCPQCQEPVQCDTTCCGVVITCPSCQKDIVVPPANEPTIQIKISSLKKAGLISLGALFTLVLVAVAIHFVGGSRTVTFKAYVDGSDILKLSGNRLWVEHLTSQQPIRMSIDGKRWDPIWISSENEPRPGENDAPASPRVLSATVPHVLSDAFKPGKLDTIKVLKRTGRGSLTIVNGPKSGSQQSLGILIDDEPMGGADSYEFTVSW